MCLGWNWHLSSQNKNCWAVFAIIGNASSFTKFLFTIFAPVNPPPPPNQQNDGFPLEFLLKGTSNRIASTQPKLRTDPPKITNKLDYEQTGVSEIRFWRVTIWGAQPSARLSEDLPLRGVLRGLCGVPRDFQRSFEGSGPVHVTLDFGAKLILTPPISNLPTSSPKQRGRFTDRPRNNLWTLPGPRSIVESLSAPKSRIAVR